MTTTMLRRHARATRLHPWLAPVAALVLALALVGCGSDGDAAGDGPPPTDGAGDGTEATDPAGGGEGDGGDGGDGTTVTVSGFLFAPDQLEVPAGTEVTWRNDDSVTHTATIDDGADPGAEDLDVSLDGAGAEGRYTFAQAGTYSYHCEIHPSMAGQVVVS